MKPMTFAAALIALLFFGSLTAVAQDAKPDEKKPDEKKAEEKFNRGDEKAEKELKKAYTRIISAEAKGLERFKADAKMVVDLSSTGLPFQVPPQTGKLLWKVGKEPHFEVEKAGKPVGGVDAGAEARKRFAPLMGFLFGVDPFDSRFKEANFKYGEAPKEDAKEKVKKTYVIVTYKDKEKAGETYVIAENKVISMAAERKVDGQEEKVQYHFTYEDKGKELKIKEVRLTSKVTIPAGSMPGGEQDPKKPEREGEKKDGEKKEGEEPPAEGEEGDQEASIDTTVKLTEFVTVGKAEVCSKMELTIEVGMRGMNLSIPASLELTNAKHNKDVTDEDLKPLEGATEQDEGF